MVDTMRDTYWDAMNNLVNEGREIDAVAVFEEWVVDGVDPQDGDVEFIFAPDLTRLVEDTLNSACASWSNCPPFSPRCLFPCIL